MIRHYLLLSVLVLIAGCTSSQKAQTLMPTPVLYSTGQINPFEHLPADLLTTDVSVFYATNRAPENDDDNPEYGNQIGTQLHLGEAIVRFGEPGTTWQEVDNASRSVAPRTPEMPMYLQSVQKMADFETASRTQVPAILPADEQLFVDRINAELAKVKIKQFIVYVHGARQNFYKSAVFTAQVNHFMGRDLVGIGYAWPTHQNVRDYVIGIDVKRATASIDPLVDLLELLAAHTDAEKINIVSWSAGGRVVSAALAELRHRYADLDEAQLQQQLRIGTVVFAAADVPEDNFLDQLTAMHELCSRLTILMSDNDGALRIGKKTMRGTQRVGVIKNNQLLEDEAEAFRPLHKMEVLDVSYFKEDRGFDITGHRYWYTNEWVNTDVLMNIRTGLSAGERGLQPTDMVNGWGFPADYPARAGAAIEAYWLEQYGTVQKHW